MNATNSGSTRLPVIIASLLVALPSIAAFASQRALEGWATQVGGGVAALLVAAYALRGAARYSRRELSVVVLSGLAAGWLIARSAAAVNPRVSLLGMLGAGDGALLWLVAWAVFAAAVLQKGDDALRSTRAVLAGLGAVAALAGLLDMAGIIPHPDSWASEPAGWLGTSNSLGQMLVLGLGASVSLALSRNARLAGVVISVLCSAGLIATESRSALVGTIIAAVAVAAVVLADSPRKRAWIAGGVGTLTTTCLFGLMAWSSASTSAAAEQFGRLLSERPALWRAAWAQVAQSPIVGSGSQMFSAFYEWAPDPTRLFGVDVTGSFSPHSLVLDWLLAGGVIGAGLGVVAIALLIRAVAPRLSGVPRSDATWPLIAGLFAWLLAALVGVTEAPALLAASALSGVLLAAASGSPADDQVARGAGDRLARVSLPVAVAAVGLVAVIALTPLYVSGARAFTWDPASVGPEELPRYTSAYERTHDPVYATLGLVSLIGQTEGSYPDQLAQDARALARRAQSDASWQVNVALLGAAAEGLRSTENTAAQFGRISTFLDGGRNADPASSVWEYLSRREATR